MRKIYKLGLLMIMVISPLFLIGCSDDSVPATDSFTVEFVDYDGTVLDTITCSVGETCDIVAPNEPNTKENCMFLRWSVFEEEYDTLDRDTTIEAIYNLDNRVVSFGNFSVAFYAFFIISGMLVGLGLGLRESNRTGVKQDDLIDGFLWIVPVAILGARLWYVIFELDRFTGYGFFPSLLRILGFQYGTLDFSTFGLSGLAIHGAFVTALICAYFYTKKRKISVLKVLDIVAVGFIIAQAFGRWGNFFNQEAHGYLVGQGALSLQEQFEYLRYTLHMPEFIVNNMYMFPGTHEVAEGFYHPTFLYESSLNLIGFGLMLVLRRCKKVHFGELMSLYLVWYGSVRIFIETMRTDPLVFELFGVSFKSAIVTSVLLILAGISLSIFIRKKFKGQTYGTVPGYFGYKKPKVVDEEKEEK